MLPAFVTKRTNKRVSEAEMRKRIEALDLSIVAWKLHLPPRHGGFGWSESKIAKLIRQYRGFLYVIWKYPNDTATPSVEMDEVWHAHMLFTVKYMRDCDYLFGRYVHHNPNFGMLKAPKKFLRKFRAAS
jgi:hypothetical protein